MRLLALMAALRVRHLGDSSTERNIQRTSARCLWRLDHPLRESSFPWRPTGLILRTANSCLANTVGRWFGMRLLDSVNRRSPEYKHLLCQVHNSEIIGER